MAEAVPFGVVANLLTMLSSSALDQIGKSYGVVKDLKKLESTLSTIKAALVDAEERPEESHSVQDWVRKLKDVVYKADDVLDAFATKVNLETANTVKDQVRDFFSSSNPFAFRIKMAIRIREIRERMEKIEADMYKFNFRERIVEIGAQNGDRGQTHCFVLDSWVIGRGKDKVGMVDLLICSNSQKNLSLIAIVGIGGLGKTTLAQLVYNDDRVLQFFELRMWVRVSEVFDVKMLVEKLIRSVTGGEVRNFKFLHIDQLRRRLREIIHEKRFLIVLDDVWNENSRSWDDLKDFLVGGAKGSSIIVTTRSKKVASIMGAEIPYVLQGLSEETSWVWFKHLAFRGRQEDLVNSRVETIAKDIIKKCRGVPVAISALGCVMQSKSAESEWLSIRDNKIWRRPQDQDRNEILPELKLSYEDLPVHLRQCFAYCSIFPKDFIISKQKLIQLWMAQGYIQSSGGNELKEDIGDRYFENLLSRSFFQEEVEKDEFGNTEGCKMHNVIHDLSQLVAGTDCLIGKISAKEKISQGVHHVLVEDPLPHWFDFLTQLQEAKGLRTFIQMGDWEIDESSCPIKISKFKSLRVLDLSDVDMKTLPNSIGKLKHLRYLNLSQNREIKRLPSSVCNLHNLQTLNLTGCFSLSELPRNTRKLVNLVYLMIDECYELTHMPVGLGKLILLQQLPRFVVPNTNLSLIKTAGTLNELKGLNHLRGKLVLEDLHNVRDAALESKEVNLKEKKYLRSLWLKWSSGRNNAQNELLLDYLQPHPSLQELLVDGYESIRFFGWLSSITKLVRITIRNCGRCTHLPPLDQLPCLKFLTLSIMEGLEYVDDGGKNFSSSSTVFFPSLEFLCLKFLPNLKGWMRSRDELINEAMTNLHCWESRLFPRLSQLLIEGCPKLTSMPLLPNLKDLTLTKSSLEIMVEPEFPKVESATMASSSLALPRSSPFPKLESLLIKDVQDWASLSEEGLPNLTSLQFLTIQNCPNASLSEEIYRFTSLQSLRVLGCPHITEKWQIGKENRSKIAHIPSIHIE